MKSVSGTLAGNEFRRLRARKRFAVVNWLSALCRATAGAAILLVATTGDCAAAATQADWTSCRSNDLDVNVAACNRIMDDPATSASERTLARLARALAYLSQNSYISAGRDLDAVLKADPGNAKALAGRSIVEFRRGNLDQAMLDLGLARRLDASSVDSMLDTYSALKEVAQAYEQKPAPEARLDELQRPLIKCRTGTRLDNLSCVPIVCPTGQRLDGNSCVQIVCSTGYRLQASTCIAITCMTGERLVGNDCQRIVCASDERLVGNDCVPNRRYGALALSRTSRIAYGMAWNRPTETQAEDDAMRNCRSQSAGTACRVRITTDACVSVYWTRTGNGWGAAEGTSQEDADNRAYSQCRSVNRSCVRAGGFCNPTN